MNCPAWDTAELPDLIEDQLSQGPPGPATRRALAPQLSYGRHDSPPRSTTRRAAVLLLLYRHQGQWHLPLTRRPQSLSVHSGQVSLPGGEIEADENPEQASVRELSEELGVIPGDLRMLGRISPINVYASNFYVTTCVAATNQRPNFVPNPAEVANLIEPSLVELFDPSRCGTRTIRRRGVEFTVPEIVFAGESIWGATRMILGELCELTKLVSPSASQSRHAT